MKTQNLQKLVELKNSTGSKQERKQLKKLKYLQPKNHDYIFWVAICYIFADHKPHKAKAHKLTSSSSQATTTEKTKLQSYIMGGILMSFKLTTIANQKSS
jgi:uncharacterized Fe-S cluster-containing radical SAM superfamily protein